MSIRGCLEFFTYIQVLISLAMIGLAGYLLASAYVLAFVAAILLMVLGVFLLLIGCFGIVGSKKRNRCCLCLYQIGTIPLAAAALIMAIVFSVYQGGLFANQNNIPLNLNNGTCVFIGGPPSLESCLFKNTGSGFSDNIIRYMNGNLTYVLNWYGKNTLLFTPPGGCPV